MLRKLGLPGAVRRGLARIGMLTRGSTSGRLGPAVCLAGWASWTHVPPLSGGELAGDGIPPGHHVIHGDIIVPNFVSPLAGAYAVNLWPDGVVPFVFDSNVLPEFRPLVVDAMMEWEAVADVRFVPRANQRDYVRIRGSNGNSSFVGMVGGQQVVNIGNFHFRYIIAHELGHVLGLWHEQSRLDRDQYVHINFDNVVPGAEFNFALVSFASSAFQYDFDSVMHYGRCDFSISGDPLYCSPDTETITVLPPYASWATRIGQRDHLSIGDAATMSFLYPFIENPQAPVEEPTNRYLSLIPNNPRGLVAFAVELQQSATYPRSTGLVGWLSAPDSAGLSRIVPDPVYRAWPEPILNLADCEILPGSTYLIRAQSESAQGTLERTVLLNTRPRPGTKHWGDCVGALVAGQWTPPNGTVNFDDVTAVVQSFQGLGAAPPVSWTDIAPAVPDQVVNITDVRAAVRCFQGEPYPFVGPGRCPDELF